MFPLLCFFDDKDNMFYCSKLHILTWLLGTEYTASDVWKYEVMVQLLSVPDTDGAFIVSIRPPIILPVSM